MALSICLVFFVISNIFHLSNAAAGSAADLDKVNAWRGKLLVNGMNKLDLDTAFKCPTAIAEANCEDKIADPTASNKFITIQMVGVADVAAALTKLVPVSDKTKYSMCGADSMCKGYFAMGYTKLKKVAICLGPKCTPKVAARATATQKDVVTFNVQPVEVAFMEAAKPAKEDAFSKASPPICGCDADRKCVQVKSTTDANKATSKLCEMKITPTIKPTEAPNKAQKTTPKSGAVSVTSAVGKAMIGVSMLIIGALI